MDGQVKRQTERWHIENISICCFKNQTSFRHYWHISAKRKTAGFLAKSARAWRGFSGKTPPPLRGADCSPERWRQTLVTVNVSTSGKTLLAGCILGTNMCSVAHCLENPTRVAPKPLSLFTRGSERTSPFSHSGCSKGKSTEYIPSSHFRTD